MYIVRFVTLAGTISSKVYTADSAATASQWALREYPGCHIVGVNKVSKAA